MSIRLQSNKPVSAPAPAVVTAPVTTAAPTAPTAPAKAPAKAPANDGFKPRSSGKAWKSIGRDRHLGGLGDGKPAGDTKLAADIKAARSGGGGRAGGKPALEQKPVTAQAGSPALAEKAALDSARAEVDAALKAGDPGKAAETLKYHPRDVMLFELQRMDGAKFNQLVDGVRSGAITDPTLAMAVSVEQVSRTSWGKNHAEQVDNLRKKFTAGKVTFAADADGAGTINPWAMTNAKGDITIDQKMLTHPEATAAALANESVHSAKTAKILAAGGDVTKRGDYLKEETDSSVAEAMVWGELRDKATDKSFAPAADSENLHNKYTQGGEALIGAETADNYIVGYLKDGNQEKIREMVGNLGDHPDYQRALTKDQASHIAQAAGAAVDFTAKDAGPAEHALRMMGLAQLALAMRHVPRDAADAAISVFAQRAHLDKAEVRKQVNAFRAAAGQD